MAFLLTAVIIAIFLSIAMAIYFQIYKQNINRVFTNREKPHTRMIPPYKIASMLFAAFLILTIAAIFILSAFKESPGGVGVTSLPLDEYLQEVENPQIEEWLSDNVDDNRKAYILKHKDDSKIYHLVYIPCVADGANISIRQSSSLFGNTVTLDYEAKDGNRGNYVTLVTYTGNDPLKIELYYGGKKVDSVTFEVEYPIKLVESSN